MRLKKPIQSKSLPGHDGIYNYVIKIHGEISPDDYVHFLWNSCWGRKYEIPLPDVEWPKIYSGIEEKINVLISKGEKQPHHRLI